MACVTKIPNDGCWDWFGALGEMEPPASEFTYAVQCHAYPDWVRWGNDVTLSTSSNQRTLLENAKHSLNVAWAEQPTSCIHNASGWPLSTGPGRRWRWLCLLQWFSASGGIGQVWFIHSYIGPRKIMSEICTPSEYSILKKIFCLIYTFFFCDLPICLFQNHHI